MNNRLPPTGPRMRHIVKVLQELIYHGSADGI